MFDFDALEAPPECRDWEIAALPGGPLRPWILVERGTTRPYPLASGKGYRRFSSYETANRFLVRLTGAAR